jgi:hypothetical protein
LTFNEPLQQVARFKPVRFDVGLSLSPSSPDVREGAPLGLGEVHLWVTCTGGRRLQEIDLRVSGAMDVLAFLPAPGVVSEGTSDVTVSTTQCRWGPTRLGSFLVLDPGGGTLCVDAEGAGGSPLIVTDCSGGQVPWPERVSFVGVDTSGGEPCSLGTGCTNEVEIDGTEEVVSVDLSTSRLTALGRTFPNPSRGTTSIRFSVARPQILSITVFDVAGRRVRTLRDGPAVAGPSLVVWDGRDESGSAVAGGVYFVRMEGEDTDETRKIVRVGPLR